MGQLLALEEFAPMNLMIYRFLSLFFISASILVSNDYFDVEHDRINAPYRPISSKTVSEREALVFSTFLIFTGFFLVFK